MWLRVDKVPEVLFGHHGVCLRSVPRQPHLLHALLVGQPFCLSLFLGALLVVRCHAPPLVGKF